MDDDMLLTRTLTVPAPADRAWTAITDLQVLASCLPGARLEAVGADGSARGSISIRAGAVRANFDGQATVVEQNDAGMALRILAEGEGSQGRAKATVAATVIPVDAASSRIELRFEIDITGRLASLGQGMAEPVIDRLIERFASALAQRVGESGTESRETGGGSEGAIRTERSWGSEADADLDLASLLPALPDVGRLVLVGAAAFVVGIVLGRMGRKAGTPGLVVIQPQWPSERNR